MKKFIEKLHFITHDIPQHSHIGQAQIACSAGAKWIQYRCLTKADEQLLEDIHAIAEICDDWGATLIVTDHIHLNGKADIQGFHIEDMDADFTKIREQLGEAVTIGGSANTIENLIRIAQEGADYAGFGPFYTTITKPNDYPLLGIEGYQQAISALKKQGIDFPILAVGGVTRNDIDPLMATGVFGIAVSAAVNQAENMYEAYLDFYDRIM
ncbi:thiamine phosphate synthase [Pedobacter sp. MC2016-24]|uniref:thiamine phosphate synthase n=1 Tax=Pedobacter sp. MC2016-24 TaxID=2780090 RepID=UPI0018830828|nr:thiamine phosphate synthase [Pedobacter sp. MC2016-24]MBE9598771.1 thiamine phosphate synthase [Pedobacter sp. MC2016-24]